MIIQMIGFEKESGIAEPQQLNDSLFPHGGTKGKKRSATQPRIVDVGCYEVVYMYCILVGGSGWVVERTWALVQPFAHKGTTVQRFARGTLVRLIQSGGPTEERALVYLCVALLFLSFFRLIENRCNYG